MADLKSFHCPATVQFCSVLILYYIYTCLSATNKYQMKCYFIICCWRCKRSAIRVGNWWL